MKNGFRVGRIFGIEIDIDWSWLLIFALISWSLAASFGTFHKDWSLAMQWGLAVLAALLFFVSVLLHELAHALVASARGLPVRNITLFLFGGVSNIQTEPKSPFGELAIALVGPLTSLVLGVVFLIFGAGTAGLGSMSINTPSSIIWQLGPVSTILIYLGSVNILVGIFNLVPGFPLDGGRIVRSILWASTGNLKKATHWASRLGQVIAWGFILAGIGMLFGFQVPLLGGGFINGIWLILIGWFLQNAAFGSYHQVIIQDVLRDIPVRQVMYTDVPTVQANIRVDKLIDNSIIQADKRAFVVYDADRMVGLVTIDDIRKVKPSDRSVTVVRDIMTPSRKLIVIAPDEAAADGLSRLQEQDIRQMPVVTGSEIVGLLRRRDILRWVQFHSQNV
jgi:Zn-dependent protease/CBS domain-containing protein